MWPSSGMLALRAYFPVQNRKPLLSYAYRCALTQIIQKSENKKLRIVFITYPPSDIIRHSLNRYDSSSLQQISYTGTEGLKPFPHLLLTPLQHYFIFLLQKLLT